MVSGLDTRVWLPDGRTIRHLEVARNLRDRLPGFLNDPGRPVTKLPVVLLPLL